MDGRLNGDDYALMDRNRLRYNAPVGTPGRIAPNTAVWLDGDLNYDSVVDSADLLLLDRAYLLLPGGSSPAALLAMREAEFGAEYVSALLTSVPEPGSLGLAAIAAGACLGGRRRRRIA
jgi:hypothetical protein